MILHLLLLLVASLVLAIAAYAAVHRWLKPRRKRAWYGVFCGEFLG